MREQCEAAKVFLLALALGAGLQGCKKEEPMEMESGPIGAAARVASPQSQERVLPAADMGGGAPESATPAAPSPLPAMAAARKLIRRVDLNLAVRDTEGAARRAQQLAERLQGYVEAMDSHRAGDLMYYEMTLRIPSSRLEEALAALKNGADRIEREQQGVEDVTSQFVDLTARMKTLKGTEAELQALLAESRSRGRKVGEIMEVFRELTGIRTQIEQIEAQVRTFDQLAALSTVKLTLTPTESAKPVAAPGWHPWDTVRTSFRSLVTLLRGSADVLIFFLIVLLPVFLLGWVAYRGVRRLFRLLRRRGD